MRRSSKIQGRTQLTQCSRVKARTKSRNSPPSRSKRSKKNTMWQPAYGSKISSSHPKDLKTLKWMMEKLRNQRKSPRWLRRKPHLRNLHKDHFTQIIAKVPNLRKSRRKQWSPKRRKRQARNNNNLNHNLAKSSQNKKKPRKSRKNNKKRKIKAYRKSLSQNNKECTQDHMTKATRSRRSIKMDGLTKDTQVQWALSLE